MRTSLAAVVLAAASTVQAAVLRREQAPAFPNPNDDPFYAVPANVSSYSLGQVINKRAVETIVSSGNLSASYQLFYRTNNATGGASATVATIFVPKSPVTPTKAFSYQFYMDSIQLDCNPSWALVNGSDSQAKSTAGDTATSSIQWGLDNGYYVITSDHEGPEAAFIAGIQEGQMSLDGLRALKNDQQLPADTQIALFGYSGGAHATAWTVELAETYAPDLRIVGSAYGGTPTDLRWVLLCSSLRTSLFD